MNSLIGLDQALLEKESDWIGGHRSKSEEDKLDKFKQDNRVVKVQSAEYKLIKYIDNGGYGDVYIGVHNDQRVAVKKYHNAAKVGSFLTEVGFLSQLSHPNIIKLYGVCLEPEINLLMELGDFGSLSAVIHFHQCKYTINHVVNWCIQTLSGLTYLHAVKPRPILHRDLKPPNMVLSDGGVTLKLCDFGISCNWRTLLTEGKGTDKYMAPDVFKSKKYSEKCDIYSFGICFWEMLTREVPFREMNEYQIMLSVDKGCRPHPVKNITTEFDTLMTSSWAGDPNSRPSAAQLLVDFQQLYAGGGNVPLNNIDQHAPWLPLGSDPNPPAEEPVDDAALNNQKTKTATTIQSEVCEAIDFITIEYPRLTHDPIMMNAHELIEKQLKPISPNMDIEESITIYNEHCKLARHYLRDIKELEILERLNKQIDEELEHVDQSLKEGVIQRKFYVDESMDLDEERSGYQDLRQYLLNSVLEARKRYHPICDETSEGFLLVE